MTEGSVTLLAAKDNIFPHKCLHHQLDPSHSMVVLPFCSSGKLSSTRRVLFLASANQLSKDHTSFSCTEEK